MPLEGSARIVRELASRGYNAEREAVTLLAGADDPGRALDRAVETAPEDAAKLTAAQVRSVLEGGSPVDPGARGEPSDTSRETSRPDDGASTRNQRSEGDRAVDRPSDGDVTAGRNPRSDERGEHPSVSTGTDSEKPTETGRGAPVETKGSGGVDQGVDSTGGRGGTTTVERSPRAPDIDNDVTGRSTGTGQYEDFVAVFRDRYERLSGQLRSRVNHRPAEALEEMPGGGDAAMVGMVNDVRSTASGHWLVELEDTSGTFPCLVMKDRDIADLVDELLYDEVIAVEGSLSDDGGILFADAIHFPDVPRTYEPSTADREVSAALISDVHVGSQEFAREAWDRFADWLHTSEAADVEYLLIAGDMVEGVGVYPDQDEELDIVDIYEQYERFSELLKDVPGDMEIVMIPGNHDAVRLAEPQPGFDDELRSIMAAHDAHISGNPSVVTVEGVSVLMYHGVSLDEVIAEFPEDRASYDEPHRAMYHLLKKRHVAPQYGGRMRLAPEEKDYLVIDDVPDVFHTGHVHKLGTGKYHNVLSINSACWQHQTAFQKSVNIDPDVGYAPIVDLSTLDVTIRKFT